MRTLLRHVDIGGLEVQGSPLAIAEVYPSSREVKPGRVLAAGDAWWCVVTPGRLLVICARDELSRVRAEATERAAGTDATIADVTAARMAVCLSGPFAREVLTRAGAAPLPPGRLLLESVGGVPTMVIHQAEERWLMVAPAGDAATLWQSLTEAGVSLGLSSEGLEAPQHQPAAANG